MKTLRALAARAACLVLLSTAALAAGAIRTVLDSARPGPTVLLVNATSGTEVSATLAIRQVSTWSLTSGRIVACEATDEAALARAIREASPQAVVRMRVERTESREPRPSTIVTRDGEAGTLRDRLNQLLDPGTAPLAAGTPANGFLPLPEGRPTVIDFRFAAGRGTVSPGERTRLFRHAVHDVLTRRGMTTSDPWTLIGTSPGKIRVAIYAGGGSSTTPGLAAYPECLDRAATEIDYTYVGPLELARPQALDPFDVVVFCGGSGSGQAKSLGAAGAAHVKAFVQRGGGYVSSCAGTYLATSGYPWSLRLVAADTVDSKHWARGTGPVDIELTELGRKILGNYPGLQAVRYANGPLLGKAKDAGGLAPYSVLAHFRSDMAKNAPGGVMPGTPAIIAGEDGQGRVLCFSPHPEYTPELRGMIVRAVKWTARRPLE